MQAQATSAAVCPECGTRLEGAFSRGLGRCMICLLRVGFDDAEEPDEKLFAPVTDRLGNYRIERHDDGTHWELGRGAMGVTYRAVDTSLQRPVARNGWITRFPPGPLAAWGRARDLPALPAQTFREWWESRDRT